MYTEHIDLRGSHFLMAVFLCTELFVVTMCSKVIAQIRLNGRHFLTARFLMYWTNDEGTIHSKWALFVITMYSKVTAHIRSNISHFLRAGFFT